MKREKIQEVMAGEDGWKVCSWNGSLYKGLLYGTNETLPDYQTDAEIDRLVRGFDSLRLVEYADALHKAMGEPEDDKILQATAEQKVEAYLKATNNWSE